LPQRIVSEALQIFLKARPRVPVEELVFLDRKLAGVFTVIAVLKGRLAARGLLVEHLRRHGLLIAPLPSDRI
jgi:hypothetical protein